MRVLLDACVPRGLAGELSRDEVQTAVDMGWGDLDDGPLLDAMADRRLGRGQVVELAE